MSISMTTEHEVRDWHRDNGGFLSPKGLAPHALKTLEEMIELCLACGANPVEILGVARTEIDRNIDKQVGKQEQAFSVEAQREAVEEEFADVHICLIVLAMHAHILHENQAVQRKLKVLHERKWAPTKDGVLVRPERLSQYE